METRLYFGLSKPGGEITKKEWENFDSSFISHVFVDGYNVEAAYGQWRDNISGMLFKEESRVVTAIYPRGRDIDKKIDSLRERYKNLFQQQSVLRTDHSVKADF